MISTITYITINHHKDKQEALWWTTNSDCSSKIEQWYWRTRISGVFSKNRICICVFYILRFIFIWTIPLILFIYISSTCFIFHVLFIQFYFYLHLLCFYMYHPYISEIQIILIYCKYKIDWNAVTFSNLHFTYEPNQGT